MNGTCQGYPDNYDPLGDTWPGQQPVTFVRRLLGEEQPLIHSVGKLCVHWKQTAAFKFLCWHQHCLPGSAALTGCYFSRPAHP